MPARLVLASGSPQRRAILDQLGVGYTAVAPEVEELVGGDPRELVVENALRKARAVEGDVVLGVDTAVALGGRVYGKPESEEQARQFLADLSGATHAVWSGIAIREGGSERTGAMYTTVRFRAFDQAEADWAVATGEWRERAGGYAIQGRGAALVERIEGDYLNVVGLPVPELVRMAPELVFGS